MKNKNFSPLRLKYTLAGVILSFFMGISLSAYFYFYTNQALKHQLIGKGDYISASLASNARYPIYTEDKSLLSHLVRGVREEKDVAYVLIVDKHEKILFSYFRKNFPQNLSNQLTTWISQQPLVKKQTVFKQIQNLSGYIQFSAPVYGQKSSSSSFFPGLMPEPAAQPQKPELIGTVHVGLSLSHLSAEIRKALLTSLLIFLIVLLAGTLGFYPLAASLTKPIELLTLTAGEIAKGDFTKRVSIDSKDEIGDLARSFNHMTESIQNLIQDINKKNEELTATNEEMAATNEQLKQVNNELQEAQDRLIRSEKLAAVGQLAGVVGHELRNPLAAVRNAAYFLSEKAKRVEALQQDEKIKQFLTIILREVDVSSQIINDLLDFARWRKPEQKEIFLDELVKESLSILEKPENVVVNLNIPHEQGIITGDPQQIRQVVINLIKNGIEAMTEGGTLTLTLSQIPQNGTLYSALKISDTGPGISEEIKSKIFEPLFTTKLKGTGLGLPVVKQNVEANQGKLELESQPGKGTTFTVYLPAKNSDKGTQVS